MTIEELQKQVGEWHIATFGECSNKRIARKLLEESAETLCAAKTLDGQGPHDKGAIQYARDFMAEEIADCAIVLLALCERNGIPFQIWIEDKFENVKTLDQKERQK